MTESKKKPRSKPPALASRFKVYKNPSASTYRVDIALPTQGQQARGDAYVGELHPKTEPNRLRSYSGQVRALAADAAARDHQFSLAQAEIGQTRATPGLLVLRELNRKAARRAGHALRGEVLLSSGRYVILADFGTDDVAIVGEISRAGKSSHRRSIATRDKADAAPIRSRASIRRRRPSNDNG